MRRIAVLLLMGVAAGAWAADEPAAAAAQGSAAPAEQSPVQRAPAADYSIDAVVRRLAERQAQALEQLAQREADYKAKLDEAQTRLDKARATLARREAEGRRLERSFESNRVELDDKAQLLKDKIGALKELFGVFQQNASDLIGAFVGSPTSVQYPERDTWLEGFAERMKDASEVSSTHDIRTLWFEMLREISARGEIAALTAPVVDARGETDSRQVVRVGAFDLITREPQPAYLAWDAGRQQIVELPRQPEGAYVDQINRYLRADDGLHTLGIDPTGGVLLSLLIEAPTVRERVDQGGLVGYMILGLGALGLVLALIKLLDIALISLRVAMQRRSLDRPQAGNSLGRLLQAYAANREVDSETLEMRLHERVQKESGRVHRFTIFLAIIAAVAPLMGLLGTVVGMINTFQAITLYGTGDPQTMAGGISQALITTVLGLVVAVPSVLLHAIVKARGNAVVNLLRQQSALLVGERLERQAAEQAPAQGGPAPGTTPEDYLHPQPA